MSGKFTLAKLMLLSISVGLVPGIASAVNLPASSLSETPDGIQHREVHRPVTTPTEADWTIQVGAYADKDRAQVALEKVASQQPETLRHATPLVIPVKLDETRTLYRARFANLSFEAASALCASLNGVGEACFLSQPDRTKRIEPVSRQATLVRVADDIRGAGVGEQARAMLIAPTLPFPDMLLAIPPLPTILADKVGQAPKLDALNANLAANKAGDISNDELAGIRGGFFTAAGAHFDFGASIKTMVNGRLALQTNLTWTPQGPSITSLSGLGDQIASQVQSNLAQAGINSGGNGNVSASTTPSLNNLNSIPLKTAPTAPISNPASVATGVTPAPSLATNTASASNAANTVSNSLAAALPAAAPAAPPTPTPATPVARAAPQTAVTIPTGVVAGVTIPGASGGSTTVLTNVSANQIQNMILNTASNQNIDQNTNVTLTMYNLQQWQQQLAQHALSSRLAGEVMAVSGRGH